MAGKGKRELSAERRGVAAATRRGGLGKGKDCSEGFKGRGQRQ